MKSIGEWFDEYSESHQNPIKKKFTGYVFQLFYFRLLELLLTLVPYSPLYS